MEKVRADKQREAGDGHDGTWVAHPGLVAIAKEIFDREMPEAEPDRPQAPGRSRRRGRSARGPRRERSPRPGCGRTSMSGSAISRRGCAASAACRSINLMEDAATAEISRAQVWQWIRHAAQLEDGRTVDAALY